MVQLLLADGITTLYEIPPECGKRQNVNHRSVHHDNLLPNRPHIRLEGLEDALDRGDRAVSTGAFDRLVATGPEEWRDGMWTAEHFFRDPDLQAVGHECLEDADALDSERVHVGVWRAVARPNAQELHVSPVSDGLATHFHVRPDTTAVDHADPVLRSGRSVFVMN